MPDPSPTRSGAAEDDGGVTPQSGPKGEVHGKTSPARGIAPDLHEWIGVPGGEEAQREELELGRRMVPLKNGAGTAELALVRLDQEELIKFLRNEHFAALRTLSEGRSEKVNQAAWQALNDEGFLTERGQVREDLKAVMIAGLRDTVAGPIIEEPLDLSDPRNAEVVERYDELSREIDERAHRTGPIQWTELQDRIKQMARDKGTAR